MTIETIQVKHMGGLDQGSNSRDGREWVNLIWKIKNIDLSRITFRFILEQQCDKHHWKKNRIEVQVIFRKYLPGGNMDM